MSKQLVNEREDEAPRQLRRGRPKGLPKPANSGRQKGTPNRATLCVREAAQAHGPKALRKLVALIASPDPRVALTAAREILDRAYGRPVTLTEITGKGGAPVIADKEIPIIDLARLTVFLLSKAGKEADKMASHNSLQDPADTSHRTAPRLQNYGTATQSGVT